jgi:hypothetical protein
MRQNNALKRDIQFQKKRDMNTKAKNNNIGIITNQNAPMSITDLATQNISNIVKVGDKLPKQSYSDYYDNEFKKGLNKATNGDKEGLIQKLSRIVDRGFASKIVDGINNLDRKYLFLYFPEFEKLVSKYNSLSLDEFLGLMYKFIQDLKGRNPN